jgi:HAE1 family hydrophobic/amphiphilic exporter-1
VISGFNLLTQSSSPAGVIFILLNLQKRTRKDVEDINEIMNEVRQLSNA